jgi:hypothetical protein
MVKSFGNHYVIEVASADNEVTDTGFTISKTSSGVLFGLIVDVAKDKNLPSYDGWSRDKEVYFSKLHPSQEETYVVINGKQYYFVEHDRICAYKDEA